MKKRSVIFFYLFLNSFLITSQNWLGETTILALKYSPTEFFNVNIPTLMFGAEIWPSHKWNFQFEYGIGTTGLFLNNDDKKDWQYKKIRFGIRRHFVADINKEKKFSILGFFGKEPLFKKRRRFIGLDIESAPESYIILNHNRFWSKRFRKSPLGICTKPKLIKYKYSVTKVCLKNAEQHLCRFEVTFGNAPQGILRGGLGSQNRGRPLISLWAEQVDN